MNPKGLKANHLLLLTGSLLLTPKELLILGWCLIAWVITPLFIVCGKLKFPILLQNLLHLGNLNILIQITYYDLSCVNWERLSLIPHIDDAWEFFFSEVTKIIDKHAPFKMQRVKGKVLPWMSRELLSYKA